MEAAEAQLQLAEIAKLRRFGRLRSRDEALARSLADIVAGRPLVELTFLDFLALGGLFLLDGAQRSEVTRVHSALSKGLVALGAQGWPAWEQEPAADWVNVESPPALEDFREEKGLEGRRQSKNQQ